MHTKTQKTQMIHMSTGVHMSTGEANNKSLTSISRQKATEIFIDHQIRGELARKMIQVARDQCTDIKEYQVATMLDMMVQLAILLDNIHERRDVEEEECNQAIKYYDDQMSNPEGSCKMKNSV